ncbi:hypothetical protein AB0M43_36195 [Longispora sp. NPDC051575]|uniref:hypothetical protein n=1 Tax=Longispora sp. NPDC051575 TaxID=3154943 RepID=UPI003415BC94
MTAHAFRAQWAEHLDHDGYITLPDQLAASLAAAGVDPHNPADVAAALGTERVARLVHNQGTCTHASRLGPARMSPSPVMAVPPGSGVPGVTLPVDLTDAEGRQIVDHLAERFGWAHAIWHRDHPQARRAAGGQLLPRQQWDEVTATPEWRKLPELATRAVADQITMAVREAGVLCAQCSTPLYGGPHVTGRLCPAHRVGPQGQPVALDPASGFAFWFDGDTLLRAEPDERVGFAHLAGAPVPPDADERDRAAALRAERRLRVLAPECACSEPIGREGGAPWFEPPARSAP